MTPWRAWSPRASRTFPGPLGGSAGSLKLTRCVLGMSSAFGQAPPEFTPDTLWVAGAWGEIYEITLSRDAEGVPQSSGVSLFASNLFGLSPGLTFFEGELYYASASEGTIYRYQADGTRDEYATGFYGHTWGLTSLLFDCTGNLLACETRFGRIWDIPFGGGDASSFSTFMESADQNSFLSLLRDPQTETLYISDWYGGKVFARDSSGTVFRACPI